MNEHYCLLCMGSNTNRFTQLSDARKALSEAFPDIHFGELMETEATEVDFILLSAISWPASPQHCHRERFMIYSKYWNIGADASLQIKRPELLNWILTC